MDERWIGPVILAAGCIFFAAFAIFVLGRLRARRRAALREDIPAEPLATADAGSDVNVPETLAAAAPEETAATPVFASKGADEEPGAPHGERTDEDEAMRRGLHKTHASFFSRFNGIFGRTGPKVGMEVVDALEELLLSADLGVHLTTHFTDALRQQLERGELATAEAVRAALRQRLEQAMLAENGGGDPLAWVDAGTRPRVVLFVGVNGVGKTTTIGKIATLLRQRDKQVVMAAGDTFRAAAAEQLSVWGERAGARVIQGEAGADPASVVFNTIKHAEQTGADVVLADTAGRLHTKAALMDEIKKVQRACGKAREGAPDETWLVLDATTGQNALQQVREFNAVLGLTGIILTKLDGTAKGGVVVNIVQALKVPVRFVGTGEKAADLRPFRPAPFLAAFFADD